MNSLVPDYLDAVLRRAQSDSSGHTAQYIPELASADPDRLSAAFATLDGTIYVSGDAETEFTIQSVSKPFVYALALEDRGFDAVHAKVDVEPSGEAFNEISLEPETGRPRNPMINAGAIAVHSLVDEPNASSDDRLERVLRGLSAFAGRPLDVDLTVCESELTNAHRNLAIAHMLRSREILLDDPAAVVEGYIRQCSINVTTADLAVMAATFANGGVNPVTGERVIAAPVVRQVLSVISTCGMYDAAGDWATQVGIPAKSGVSGGMIGALPGQLGIATFSPRLDSHGNSVRGVAMFERFSRDMGLHVMEVPPTALSTVRSNRVHGTGPDGVRAFELQGGVRFAGAERVVREVMETAPEQVRVVLDFTKVSSVDDVARRMLLEVAQRLLTDRHDVYIVDPDAIIVERAGRAALHLSVIDRISSLTVS
ncbi:glutaminase [Microbacterium sp.]|uniref:glutaminase n=1 Tax=Microbacterium sp. TaxID=51671 RepID=UPI003F701A03